MKRRELTARIGRLLGWLILLTLVAAAALALVGIPAPLLRPALVRLEREGLRLSVNRVRLLPWQGIVMDGLHVTPAGDSSLFFSAAKLVLTVDRFSPTPELALSTTDGALFAELPAESPDTPVPPPLIVEAISGFLSWDGERRLRFALSGAAPGRARLSGVGTVALATSQPLPPNAHGEPTRRFAERLKTGLQPILTQIAQRERQLQSHVRFGELPRLTCHVDMDGDRPQADALALDVTGGQASVHDLSVEHWRFGGSWARTTGTRLNVLATLPGCRMEGSAERTPQRAGWDGRAEFDGRLANVRSWLPPVVAKWPVSVDTLPPLRLTASFRNLTTNAATLALDFTVQTPSPLPEDDALSAIHCAGAYTNGVLELSRFFVRAPQLTDVLRPPWRLMLSDLRIGLDGPVCIEGRCPPTPVADFAQRFSADVQADALTVRGVAFSNATARVERDGARLTIPRTHAILANERLPVDPAVPVAGTCDLTGRFVGNLATGTWEAAMDFTARLATALPFLPSNVAAVVSTVRSDEPCHAALALRHEADQGSDVSVSGRFTGRGLVRNGERATMADASFSWANGALVFAPLHVVHDSGVATGEIAWETARTSLHVNVTCSANPHAIARLVGRPLTNWLASFRTQGPTRMRVCGSVDLADGSDTRVAIEASGERLGYGPFLAESASLPMEVTDRAVSVAPFRAAWCGGTVTGRIEVARPPDATATVCRLNLVLDRGEFARVIQVLRGGTNATDYTGDLSGQLRLAGPVGPDYLRQATGGGDLRIANGELLSIPLFGGLSRYLSLLLPGLGYLSQRDFHANFEVGGNRVRTEEAYLLGNVLSMRGRGAYGFDGDLGFRVEVKFLREGITATVARLITSPLTKALEFQLSGTPSDPRWRPVNSPERLLEFFSKMLPPEKPAP